MPGALVSVVDKPVADQPEMRPAARAMPAVATRTFARHAAEVLRGYGEHQELTAGELDRVEGALWIRPLWLAAWQCWLAAVSARVNRAHVPDASRIAALAASVQAAIAAYQSAARSSRARD